MQTAVILNPKAGNWAAKRHFPRIIEFFQENNLNAQFIETEAPGHAQSVASSAAREGVERLVVAGGDGTLNEVVNGIMHAGKGIPLGIIPLGSCNDFIKSTTIPSDLDGALKTIQDNNPKPFDVGMAGDRYFINSIGLGFDVAIVKKMQSTGGKNNFAKYLATVLSKIMFYKGLSLIIDSEPFKSKEDTLLLTIANGKCFGGNFNIAPHAEPDDGKLDGIIIGNVAPVGRIGILSKVFSGKHIQDKRVKTFQVTGLELRSESELEFQVEGELFIPGKKEISIKVLPGQIKIFVPQNNFQN